MIQWPRLSLLWHRDLRPTSQPKRNQIVLYRCGSEHVRDHQDRAALPHRRQVDGLICSIAGGPPASYQCAPRRGVVGRKEGDARPATRWEAGVDVQTFVDHRHGQIARAQVVGRRRSVLRAGGVICRSAYCGRSRKRPIVVGVCDGSHLDVGRNGPGNPRHHDPANHKATTQDCDIEKAAAWTCGVVTRLRVHQRERCQPRRSILDDERLVILCRCRGSD